MTKAKISLEDALSNPGISIGLASGALWILVLAAYTLGLAFFAPTIWLIAGMIAVGASVLFNKLSPYISKVTSIFVAAALIFLPVTVEFIDLPSLPENIEGFFYSFPDNPKLFSEVPQYPRSVELHADLGPFQSSKMFSTRDTVSSIVKFFRTELPKHGWEEISLAEFSDDDCYADLHFSYQFGTEFRIVLPVTIGTALFSDSMVDFSNEGEKCPGVKTRYISVMLYQE